MLGDVIDKTTGKPRLLAAQCATCIGRPAVMQLRPGRLAEVIQANTGDALGLICHETIDYDAGTDDDGEDQPGGDRQAFCRWFYDKFGARCNYLRICERLGGFTEIPPPPDPRIPPPEEGQMSDDVCGCCEINDYDPAPDDSPDAVPGSCLNCGHSPEEHEPPASPCAATRAYGATGCT